MHAMWNDPCTVPDVAKSRNAGMPEIERRKTKTRNHQNKAPDQ